MTTAQHRVPDHDVDAGGGLRIRIQPALCPTDDQFYEFCRINRELRKRGGSSVGGYVRAWIFGEQPL